MPALEDPRTLAPDSNVTLEPPNLSQQPRPYLLVSSLHIYVAVGALAVLVALRIATQKRATPSSGWWRKSSSSSEDKEKRYTGRNSSSLAPTSVRTTRQLKLQSQPQDLAQAYKSDFLDPRPVASIALLQHNRGLPPSYDLSSAAAAGAPANGFSFTQLAGRDTFLQDPAQAAFLAALAQQQQAIWATGLVGGAAGHPSTAAGIPGWCQTQLQQRPTQQTGLGLESSRQGLLSIMSSGAGGSGTGGASAGWSGSGTTNSRWDLQGSRGVSISSGASDAQEHLRQAGSPSSLGVNPAAAAGSGGSGSSNSGSRGRRNSRSSPHAAGGLTTAPGSGSASPPRRQHSAGSSNSTIGSLDGALSRQTHSGQPTDGASWQTGSRADLGMAAVAAATAMTGDSGEGPAASSRRFARPPPPPPLTPPTLSTPMFTFEDRRPSYAISIPPELDTSFIHQPNPDYIGSASSTSADMASSPKSATTPRRRSYTKSVPIGIPVPGSSASRSTSSSQDTMTTLDTFSPASYPPASPLLPPPPPGHAGFETAYDYDYGAHHEVAGPSGRRSSGHAAEGDHHGAGSEIDLQGEIISVMDGAGHGWKRHTRVYGGGVCLACVAAGGDGGFYGDKVPLEERR